ncbi:LolA family protein [Pseudomonas saliphila]|uniref:LolA family protein n=1 Tax=Pseudomonas saliphila TaxID=2586906 RepID=UPI00123AE64B|nr:outer membrane lipoprotein carrier protein LolA [Pseudomonas saliphila]
MIQRPVLTLGVLALVWASLPAHAQTPDAALREHLRTNAPACGEFEQSRWLADFDMHLNSRGTFQRQDQGLIWRTLQPVHSEVVLSENNPDLPLGYQAVLPIFNGLLAGNWQSLDQYFATTLSGTADAWRAELAPRNAQAAQLSGLSIEGAAQLERITISFNDGDRMDIHLTETACPPPVEAH